MHIAGQILNAGVADADALLIDEPLSFWGGFDPETGTIIDRQHPQVGETMTGKIIVMPGSRGSSGTPGVLGEALRLKTGPCGIILSKADINVTAAALVVATLYDQHCPVIAIAEAQFDELTQALRRSKEPHLRIGVDGSVSF
ncbi:DUF126 domain-containing protein [Pararhizobium sp. YC-54]|uniref:aconitase X swivel domain-containing protein n=1 Tax=Pararhizobium sp. YC-54 TaxID=2986920 RepID=UPI0021F73BA5|nr:DUF126 domain-containing protein [Pararhizobium sp. YC-54]MCW0001894.1 DUF126 domain-containing protein [Pararhizobium sp. YC-54]